MSVRAGQILHAMNNFVVDRIQTAGPGNLNIPTEKIKELGNFESVAVVRDIPDLSFNLECLDVDTEVEAMLTGSDDPLADPMGTEYNLLVNEPIDIVSPMKSNVGEFNIVKSIGVPHLSLESASYRFGLQENAGETFTLRGDSIFYIPGSGLVAQYDGDGATTAFAFANTKDATPAGVTALVYTEAGVTTYALNVSVDGQRMVRGDDYTETNTGITFNTAPANGAEIRIMFGATEEDYFPQSIHEGTSVKPAAIRGKDIDVYVGTDGATPANPLRWTDVQSATVDWRVTIEDDFEFGNPRAVSREATDVPEVSGTVEVKPFNLASWFDKIAQMTGVPAGEIVGPQSSVTLPIEIVLRNPESGGTDSVAKGTVLKTLYIPDARFVIPGYEGRVEQKYVTTLNFESDGGNLKIYKGARP